MSENEKKLKVTITVEVAEQRVQDLLCCALEGGSNYWCRVEAYIYPKGQTKESLGIEFSHLELPFKGGSLVIGDKGDSEPDKVLDLEALTKGLTLLAEKYPKHWVDFMAENEDAITGDVFLQLCLFGEVVFG